jgi:hypothetical protein
MMPVSDALRDLVKGLRLKPKPLADLIPDVQALADRVEKMEEALDALLLAYAHSEAAGDGGSVDWDDIDEAFDQAKKCRPGKYEALVRELGGS